MKCRLAYRDSWSHFDVPTKRGRFAELSAVIQNPALWKDQSKLGSINKELKSLQGFLVLIDSISAQLADLLELLELDSSLSAQAEIEADKIELELKELEALNFDPNDDKATYVTIQAGTGGHEACSWAQMLLRMYYKHAKRQGLTVELVDLVPYEPSGIRSVVFKVSGIGAFKCFRNEAGVHRLSRVSPYDQADRRQTSFAAVEVEPEAEPEEEFMIPEKDLEIEFCCGGGPGGQAVNKKTVVAMVRHIPTGIVVRSQNGRSQSHNKETAISIIHAKLLGMKNKEKEATEKEKREKVAKADFGNKSRSYVLSQHPQIVDHRTGKKVMDVDAVLNGNINLLY